MTQTSASSIVVAGPSPTDDKARVADLVARHGWNATAFQTLETGYSYFFRGDDACVAYVDTGGAWVAAGAPVAPDGQLADVLGAFVAEARANRRRCCFFGAEERLLTAAGSSLCAVRIGEQPTWDPRDWPSSLRAHRSLREQLRRARAKGVRIRKVTAAELESGATRDAISRITERWLATRAMATMGFLVRVEPFTFPSRRSCFVAEVGDDVIGFAAAVPVPLRNGWFIEDLVRDPRAPNGTSELLVDAVMQWAAAERCTWVTLGLAPLAGDVAKPLKLARTGSRFLYDFDGLRAYKAKLRPNGWSPIYLAYPPSQAGPMSILDSLTAFADGSLTRFVRSSLMRGRSGWVRALALIVAPLLVLLVAALELSTFAAACATPLLAAVVVWGSRAHRPRR